MERKKFAIGIRACGPTVARGDRMKRIGALFAPVCAFLRRPCGIAAFFVPDFRIPTLPPRETKIV
jgi:hypothetical protein